MPRGKVLVKKRSGGDLDCPCVDNTCSGEFRKIVVHYYDANIRRSNIGFVTMLYISEETNIWGCNKDTE